MALSQDQYFDQYWPSSEYYQQVQDYANNAVIIDGNRRRKPTGGEVARIESQLRSAARGSSQFQQSWSSYSAQEQALAQAQAQQQELERQKAAAEQAARELAAEQARLQAQFKAEQEAISKKQLEESAAINLQLTKERQAAEKEQALLKTQFETERQQTEKLIGEAQAETARQQISAKREAATALNISKQSAFTKLRQAAPVRQPQIEKKKPMIGQPGVSSTRFSSRAGIGGYGGTAAGRINPTGLNI
jgi:DNA repair exonuclease SbcCD ATPase subunit